MGQEKPNRQDWQREEIAEDETMEIWEKIMRQRAMNLIVSQLVQTEGHPIPSPDEAANS